MPRNPIQDYVSKQTIVFYHLWVSAKWRKKLCFPYNFQNLSQKARNKFCDFWGTFWLNSITGFTVGKKPKQDQLVSIHH